MTKTPIVQSPGRHGLDLLAQARRRVDPELREWVWRLPAPVRSWAGYHLGLLAADGRPGTASAGKAVRPALALASARAVGGDAADAVSAAVAVELVHDFSLAHDDIIDRDEVRRHRPALWKAFGVPAAILTGDVLLTLGCQVLAETPGPDAARSISWLAQAVVELIRGEAADVAFEVRPDVTLEEYIAMASGKTGALMACACALGALAAGAGEARARHLADFGRHLGVAFQIMDDILGIFGSSADTGKPVGADIAARKKTYPVLLALAGGGATGARLAELLAASEPLTGRQLEEAARWVEASGGRRLAQEAAERELSLGLAALAEADPDPDAVHDLTALAHVLTHRDA